MKYIIYTDRNLTKVREVVKTNNRQTINAIYNELKRNGYTDISKIDLPFKFHNAGIEILSLEDLENE